MADDEDLRRALDGAKDLTHTDLRKADLSGRDFSGCDFSGANISNADFSSCNLTNALFDNTVAILCKFDEADFRGARIHQGNFGNSSFSRAKLNNLDLTNVFLQGAKFLESDLRGANFKGAQIGGADTRFDGAIVDAGTEFDGAKIMRAPAQDPAFLGYVFDKGSLRRKDTLTAAGTKASASAFIESQEAILEAAGREPAVPRQRQQTDARRQFIVRLKEAPSEIATIVVALRLFASAQLAEEQSKVPPNDPDRRAEHDNGIEAIAAIVDDLSAIGDQLITDAGVLEHITDSAAEIAGDGAGRLYSHLTAFWDGFGRKAATAAGTAGVMALCGTLVGLGGLPAIMGAAPALWIMGGGGMTDGLERLSKAVAPLVPWNKGESP